MGKLANFINKILSKPSQPTEPAKSEFGPGVGRKAEETAKEQEFAQAVERERHRRPG